MLPSPEPVGPDVPATPGDIAPGQRRAPRTAIGPVRQACLGALTILLVLAAIITGLVLIQLGPLADAAGGCGGG